MIINNADKTIIKVVEGTANDIGKNRVKVIGKKINIEGIFLTLFMKFRSFLEIKNNRHPQDISQNLAGIKK